MSLDAQEGDPLEQIVGITQIRLLNSFTSPWAAPAQDGTGRKQAIQDLRDIWNRFIDGTQRLIFSSSMKRGATFRCNNSV